jgi:hypothetical protein
MSTAQSSWGNASIINGAGTDSAIWTWVWGTDTLLWGENFLCAVALDSQTTSTNNHGIGTSLSGNITVYPIYRIKELYPPAATVLISPFNGEVDLTRPVNVLWHSSSGAMTYRLQIATDTGFTSLAVNLNGLTDTSRSVSGLSESTTYYWRVRAGNGDGFSCWSSGWTFSTIAVIPDAPSIPVLFSPANGTLGVSTDLLVSWNSSARAASYTVQVSTDSNFSSLTVDDSGVIDNFHTVTGLSTFVLYYWRVRAVNAGGASDWSTVWNFITGATLPTPPVAPILFSPANSALNVSINSTALSWNSTSGAAWYAVQISTDSIFSNIIVNDSGITSTTYAVSGLSLSIVYYWRVKAVNAGGSSDWSETQSFTTTSSGVLPYSPPLPRVFSISGSSGIVRYSLPSACQVSLKYYDLRGRLTASLINTMQGPGYYVLSVKSALPSNGSYIRVFEAGSFVKKSLVAVVR